MQSLGQRSMLRAEGLIEGLAFQGFGFRVYGKFRVLGFRGWGLGFLGFFYFT